MQYQFFKNDLYEMKFYLLTSIKIPIATKGTKMPFSFTFLKKQKQKHNVWPSKWLCKV